MCSPTLRSMYDADGLPHVLLAFDEAMEIQAALETALQVAPVAGGLPLVVAQAHDVDFYRWQTSFARALGAITDRIAGCLEMPATTAASTAVAVKETPADPMPDSGLLAQMVETMNQVGADHGIDVEQVAHDAGAYRESVPATPAP